MKDSEFTELLNLYLDHEISAVDAARLEAEVQNNPARRRIYEDYCRMQKACRMLAHDFQTEPVEQASRKVIDFNPAARRSRASFYTVGAVAAAAACAAIVFVGQTRKANGTAIAGNQDIAAIATPATAANVALAQATATKAPADVGQDRPQARELSFARDAQAQALLATSVEQANAQFEWLRNFQLAPLQQPAPNDALRFGVRPALGTEPQTYRSRQPVDATIEMTAFRFQR